MNDLTTIAKINAQHDPALPPEVFEGSTSLPELCERIAVAYARLSRYQEARWYQRMGNQARAAYAAIAAAEEREVVGG